jgi:hypothetical protein
MKKSKKEATYSISLDPNRKPPTEDDKGNVSFHITPNEEQLKELYAHLDKRLEDICAPMRKELTEWMAAETKKNDKQRAESNAMHAHNRKHMNIIDSYLKGFNVLLKRLK